MKLKINHEQLLDGLSVGIIAFNVDAEITYANGKAIAWLGLVCEVDSRRLVQPTWQIVDKFGEPLPFEKYPGYLAAHSDEPIENYEIGVFNHLENCLYWFLCDAYKSPTERKGTYHYVVTFTNITAQKELIPFKEVVEHANDAVIVSDAIDLKGSGPSIVYVNKEFTRLTGYSYEEAIGRTTDIVQGEKTSPVAKKHIIECLSQGKPVREEIINYTKSGQPYWIDVNIVPLKNDSGVVTHYAAIERDITKIKDKAFNLEKLAKTDALTEVLNRRGLNQDGERFINLARHNEKSFVVAVMDIDRFKNVNDTHGHDVGDVVLKSLADILVDNIRTRDLVSRMGGEEFVILLEGDSLPLMIQKIENLRQLIEKHVTIIKDDLSIQVTCSFGIAVAEEGVDLLRHYLKLADVALYQSKNSGRNKISVANYDHP
ncbi:diguanylate cyclase [Psychrosphaera ytuae]|uniref:Diguanylate cyclase n=1 Tax=Psychrosphaera ytuae TaxID=2820710 RepID=A0A975DAK1_9GAMM|nr:sensor domain-containing diguanylate cyclase [Psychrosphaera ytuae]QTH63219.1 diguanylate cyclase [Psychrosphaera ytuae]